MPHSQGIAHEPGDAENIITLTPPHNDGADTRRRLDQLEARIDALCDGLARIQHDLDQLKETR